MIKTLKKLSKYVKVSECKAFWEDGKVFVVDEDDKFVYKKDLEFQQAVSMCQYLGVCLKVIRHD